MVAIALSSWVEIREHPELHKEYAEECGWPELGPPNPQWDIYAAMEAAGVSIVLAVTVDGVLAGFACLVLSILPHFGIKVGTTTDLFVGKAYRKRGAGTWLRVAIRDAARSAGCERLFTSAPAGGRLEKILENRGTRTNSIFCETL